MKILSIDTSSIVSTVSIMDEHKLMGEEIVNSKLTHSEKLMPAIDRVLKNCDLTIDDIDVIAVALGPGSFTGIRIGIATAKALAHSKGKNIIGISTLDGLALNMPMCHMLVCPILDARRNQVYTAVYKWDRDNLEIIRKHEAIELDSVLEYLMDRPESVVFLGDGVEKYRQVIEEKLKDKAYFAPNSVNMPRASSIGEIALKRASSNDFDNLYGLNPTYLRKSEAERQYEEKMRRCDSND
ncbi:MAG: tRNA (adenosine(37)-N6)-threonylcarbamoyltransferase complex dimerization subunit type 1 TsaB [Anaeromicrobium sp.]|jgi:tRNA threonylcarbamoyladenosine biosynthesis protein TsaB|uniref:tRNA (adenosine(37)-N6)-threonylcarbamoyltransferase complex dimerization subunit type 1 TsaB n=1 Tax=Anaeromicrobium sp. TaxID=1929132 RepID=UPI0025CC9C74|nr:tRNA (adenosine(37)-N6)-threonylcarbamoyltransferase complex dimerization subunit type 1 TsaB [Anaeromicrobium sp.]MCT4592724.1 tRNA (adenosine(37)-N6)-threonylcarbamoyltransferase complex dimerization subunit type 1 TsaB [Anaeromicrobium sp.]